MILIECLCKNFRFQKLSGDIFSCDVLHFFADEENIKNEDRIVTRINMQNDVKKKRVTFLP